jgi:hypothetical protein
VNGPGLKYVLPYLTTLEEMELKLQQCQVNSFLSGIAESQLDGIYEASDDVIREHRRAHQLPSLLSN